MTSADPVPVVDGHNDLVFRLWEEGTDGIDGAVAAVARGDADRHLDRPRAREAGLRVGFFAGFVPNEGSYAEIEATDDGYRYPYPDALDRRRAKRIAYEQLELLHRLAAEVDGFRVVESIADVEACLDGDALGAIPHLEGAEPVAADLSNLDFLRAAGVRSIGPAWSRPNAFADGVPFEYPGHPDAGDGLTEAGRDLVRACEERGIVVDCAHLTARGFRDVADETDAPLVVSHAAAHELVPHSRNLTDGQLRRIADRDGLVGITFGRDQLRDVPDRDADVPLSALVDHVAYVADEVGVEHVALGSDFDGATIPEDVGDVTGVPDVLAALRDRGFSGRDVRKVARGNWLRVLRAWWDG